MTPTQFDLYEARRASTRVEEGKMKITDTDILNWLETNADKILISKPFEWNRYDQTVLPQPRRLVFQRLVRMGLSGQAIYSEREYFSLREMAIHALKQ